MVHTFHSLLDFLFPPRETEKILRMYRDQRLPMYNGCKEGIFYCAEYSHPGLKAAIQESKFYNHTHAQQLLAQMLTQWLHNKQLESVSFIPIPLGKERLKSRGHNQVTSVLNKTSYIYKIDVLQRPVETVPQSSLAKSARAQNIKNVFQCNTKKAATLKTQTVILLDDVVTTGSTLNEARATLAPHLPSDTQLICLSLTH